MRLASRAAVTTAMLLALTAPAQGQGFLKSLKDRVVQQVEQKAEQTVEGLSASASALAPTARSRSRSSDNARSEAAPEVMTPKAVGGANSRPTIEATAVAPAPVKVKYTGDLQRPVDFEAVRDAYTAFGKVDCPSCEGGFAYDSWARFPKDEHSGKYNESGKRLGALKVGTVHRWKGEESIGTLTVLAEEQIQGLRCKKLQYRLTKGQASAERPGLVCWGFQGSLSGSEDWNEVY